MRPDSKRPLAAIRSPLQYGVGARLALAFLIIALLWVCVYWADHAS